MSRGMRSSRVGVDVSEATVARLRGIGLPPGLAYLDNRNEIKVVQLKEMCEAMTGYETNNKYEITTRNGIKFMHAVEDTDPCTRQCCGALRPFDLDIMDNNGRAVIRLDRPFRCTATVCCCCCLQELNVQCPPGVHVGKVQQMCVSAVRPTFEIMDASDNVIFIVKGSLLAWVPCIDAVFNVMLPDSDHVVGQITKHWMGCEELCGQNEFSLTFPPDMDILQKAILLGATFLIDFNYFER